MRKISLAVALFLGYLTYGDYATFNAVKGITEDENEVLMRDAGATKSGDALQPARDGVRADVPTRESGCAVSDSATRLATTSMVCRVSGKTKRIFGASCVSSCSARALTDMALASASLAGAVARCSLARMLQIL